MHRGLVIIAVSSYSHNRHQKYDSDDDNDSPFFSDKHHKINACTCSFQKEVRVPAQPHRDFNSKYGTHDLEPQFHNEKQGN